jgi:2-polyprenyl-6-methoxyphenol hydroxylase-like FAD-dependent oxidoreductase
MSDGSEKENAQKRLRVIIVGGSIAGLALAHCLHTNPNIDYVVLEGGAEMAPQVGASIVVLPNGARILDQLGIWDDIMAMIEPLAQALTWTDDGKNIVDSNAPLLGSARLVNILSHRAGNTDKKTGQDTRMLSYNVETC